MKADTTWPSGQWSQEHLAAGEMHCHKITSVLQTLDSGFQRIEVVETEGYGRGLFLDGRIQHIEHDEYIYSEAIVHPAALMLCNTLKTVLVVGGGPGGVIREVLKHHSVSHVVQVDIDRQVIELCRSWFPHIAKGCYDDPRVELVVSDIRDFASSCANRFDLIVNDISEPMEGTPAEGLFGNSIIQALASLLSPSGIFVTWAGSVGPASFDLAVAINQSLSRVYTHQVGWLCHPQAYGTSWLTIGCSMEPLVHRRLSPREIDAWLSANVGGDLALYDGETDQHMFSLPKDVRRFLSQEARHGEAMLPTISHYRS
ncbi:hypothetical protein [Rhodomicrobium sp.]|uniref:spermine/spermidine synthase domain-containing protein n=1 Tax=Rhodomicrobium sp. TaxID=2720632 RepID=UPI0039E54BAD